MTTYDDSNSFDQETFLLLVEIQQLKAEKRELQLQLQYCQEQRTRLDQEIELQHDRLEKAETESIRLSEQNLLVYINNSMNQPNDKSQNISVGGDFNINANQSVVNLRDIIGTVNSTIEQIPSTANQNQEELKQLLQELTTAIEMEASLDNEEKAEAANQVKKIAEAAQNPDDKGLTTKAKRAVGFLEMIAKGLEPASKLVKACQKGLPLILAFLGLG